jgi:anti-anti-sigma factor
MRAPQRTAPLVVVRSEAESGRVGLRLIGELDFNTVDLLEAELAGSREQSPPAVIDLSELRFLDLVGLRSLMRAGQADGAPTTRLVGATGIVRRLIELTRALDAESAADGSPLAGEQFTRVTAGSFAEASVAHKQIAANGNGNGATRRSNGNGNGNGNGRAGISTNLDAP